jgi:cytoskeletal protein CcmA (bactofilin family)
MTSDDSRPRRRFHDAQSGTPTLLGGGGRVEGRLSIPGPLTLSGTVVADGEVGGVLTIGRSGAWHGYVHAHAAVVLGELRGTLTVDTTLELGRTAVVHGTVRAALVAIADGAVIDGDIEVTGSTPVVHFTDRRRPPDEPGAGGGGG